MTEDAPEQDTIAELKTLFSQQIAELREQNEQVIAGLNQTIDRLTRDNRELQAAVVRSATMDPPEESEPPRTEAEIYADRVESLAAKAVKYSELKGGY